MSIDTLDRIAVILAIVVAPAAVLFAPLYTVFSPWWTTLAGRGLMVKAWSNALLIGLLLLVRVVEIDPYVAAWLRVVILALICVGVNLLFIALIREYLPRFRLWVARRTS